MVPVAHEVQVADLEERDGRHRLAAALGGRDPLPARPQPLRGGAEAAVEVGGAVDRPDDVVELDDLQAAIDLSDAPERVDDLLEREDHRHVVRLAAQAPGDVGQQPRPPGAAEVVLSVLRGGAGAHRLPEAS